MSLAYSTLDNFDRPDNTTLGPNWSPTSDTVTTRHRILSNCACASSGSVGNVEWWNPGAFTDCELRMDFQDWLSSSGIGLCGRIGPPAGSYPHAVGGYYNASFSPSGASVAISAVDPVLGGTTLASDTGWVIDNDGGAAIRCEGSTISAWIRFDSSSPWQEALSVTDTTYPGPGYLGVELIDTAAIAAGATVGATPIPPTAPIDIGRRLLATSLVLSAEAIDLNSPLYH